MLFKVSEVRKNGEEEKESLAWKVSEAIAKELNLPVKRIYAIVSNLFENYDFSENDDYSDYDGDSDYKVFFGGG